MKHSPTHIRNIAIVAHVDHGKTTIVDGLLKQSHLFRDNQAEMNQTTILDSGDLERERGITITAKTTAVEYQHNSENYKINIIDTPGHADFSGEVERTLSMADGIILVVDAQEGPMPQTKFVLTRALKLGLTPVVVINKIDKDGQRVREVEDEIGHLFLDLAISDDQLEYPVYYAIGREGKAWSSLPENAATETGDFTPIFEAIITQIPAPRVEADKPFQMLVTSLAWDSYQGKYAIGRIQRGSITSGDAITRITADGKEIKTKVDKIFVSQGLDRVEIPSVEAGEIAQLTGISDAQIGETLADSAHPEALPVMEIEAPTLQIAIGPNTSPFAGKEGKYTTSRQIAARLDKELETNVSLRVDEKDTTFLVSGRGELHLSVLIETLRREGFELEVGRPTVVYKEENGVKLEPVEELMIEVPDDYTGAITSELGQRRATLIGMEPTSKGATELVFQLPTRALLGLRNILLTATKGTVIMNSLLIGYEPVGAPLQKLRNGVLISAESGNAVTYSLKTVEERGTAFIGPGTKVYEGMIIGLNRRSDDMEINVCKEKKLTNVRASSTDMTTQLTPYTDLSLEEALDFIEDDELLEVTPENLRLRKRGLKAHERKKFAKK
ncbi:translational GTPase TypA [Candidatus Saccharibacteria bacterium]|nr:translational GTPase TypA [Candidatus Saccharibacteria bacterium]